MGEIYFYSYRKPTTNWSVILTVQTDNVLTILLSLIEVEAVCVKVVAGETSSLVPVTELGSLNLRESP